MSRTSPPTETSTPKFSEKYGTWWKLPPKEPQSAEWYAKMMRHYNPMIRTFAARCLGTLGDEAIPHIAEALKSNDARLRVAGMETLSAVGFWGVNFDKTNAPVAKMQDTWLPVVKWALGDVEAPMWEKRHALMLLSRADPATISAQHKLIIPYLGDDEWFLRVAACTALEHLVGNTEKMRIFLPALFAQYDMDTNLTARRWGFIHFFSRLRQ